MGEVIGIVSLKGGVGKTTLSIALASELANRYRKRILLIDANYSAPNVGIHMGVRDLDKSIQDFLFGEGVSSIIKDAYNVKIIPGSLFYDKGYSPLKLKDKLSIIKKNYDFVILDSSPSLNEEILSSIFASDKLFIVTTPDYPSLSCCMKVSKIIKQRDKEVLGIIVNRAVRDELDVSLDEIEGSTGIPVIATIREDGLIRRALSAGVPLNLAKQNSSFSKEIRKIGAILSGEKEKRSLWKRLLFVDMDKEEVNREILRKSFYTSAFK